MHDIPGKVLVVVSETRKKSKGIIFGHVHKYIIDGGHKEPTDGMVWWIIAICRGKLDPRGLIDYAFPFPNSPQILSYVSKRTDDFVDRLGKWSDFERRHKLDEKQIETAGDILADIARQASKK